MRDITTELRGLKMSYKLENLNIFALLTSKQQDKLYSMGFCGVLLEQIPLEDFRKITSNEDIINRFIKYKFSFKLRLVS